MLAKLNMNTPCVAASRDLTANEPVTKASEALFHNDCFVAHPASPRLNQPRMWWSELEAHIQALPTLNIELQEVDERLLDALRTIGLSVANRKRC